MRATYRAVRQFALLASLTFASASAIWAQTNLENPYPGARVSGIGLVSGWTCSSGVVEVSFDNGPRDNRVPLGAGRGDLLAICGRTDVGFGLLFNYNLLGPGNHTIQLFVNGVQVGNSVPFTVTVPGGEFIRGAVKSVDIPNFPKVGQTTRVDWQESTQNFAIVSSNGVGFQTTLDTFPILFEGIRLLGATVAASPYGDCDMTVRFQNARNVPLDPFLYFDIVQGGVTTGQEIFHISGIQPGVTAEDTTTVLAGGRFLDCGTFQVRFNGAASNVFD